MSEQICGAAENSLPVNITVRQINKFLGKGFSLAGRGPVIVSHFCD